jgi:hypothetical protein
VPDDLAAPSVLTVPAPECRSLEQALGDDWRLVPDAVIRVKDEAGTVDLAALHPRRGAVLVAFVADGEEASPEEAVTAFRAMLGGLGFAERFPGTLKVAALALGPKARARIAEAIRTAAGEPCEAPPEPLWVAWLARRLAADATPLRLPHLDAPREPIMPRPPARPRTWPLTFACLAAAFVLAGYALYARSADMAQLAHVVTQR